MGQTTLYSILVVDDEREIRRGIVDSINWAELGFYVVGEAENGIQAVTLIEESRPDVVLSDIRMPGIDGIELMQFVRENYPDTAFAVLSGYSDFEYMKSAIAYDVVTYLLKPTDLSAFESAFHEMKARLDKRRKEKRRLAESSAHLRDSLLTQLVQGRASEMPEALALLEKEGLTGGFCGAKVVAASPSAQWFEKHGQQWPNIRRVIVSLMNGAKLCEGVFFLYDHRNICGILQLGDKEWGEIAPGFKERLRTQLNIGDMLFSNQAFGVHDAHGLHSAYEAACLALDVLPIKSEAVLVALPSVSQMISMIADRDEQRLESHLDALLLNAAHKMCEVNMLCMRFLFRLSDGAKSAGVRLPKILQEQGYSLENVYHIPAISGKKGFILYCANLVFQAAEGLLAPDSNEKLANDVFETINELFCSDQLSLGLVARKLKRSEAYVSRCFKEVSGLSFVQFVRQRRMEKAMQLLRETPMWVYEVAQSVGYSDTSTFMKVFKSYVGKPPAEYRRLHEGEEK
jgi:Response regulator containing CheY-like receiver domain and AraC-type DNA-binding domain